MAQHGFHWWPRVGIAVCSDRPRHIHWDNNKRLHADGKLAVEFSDGWGLYSFHGVRLPETYGKVKSEDWDANWILKEENQELRRTLLENIPPVKVATVLNLKSLDTFKSARSSYELVEAQNNPYPSRYRALRFKCPSTERPYLVRVHPDVETAEAAIVSLNKGAHPDSFIWEH